MNQEEKIEPWPVFICYRRDDGEQLAKLVFSTIQGKGFAHPLHNYKQVFFDVYLDKVQGSDVDFRKKIVHHINQSKAFILIVSRQLLTDKEDDLLYFEIQTWLKRRPSDTDEFAPILVTSIDQNAEKYIPKLITDIWADINVVKISETTELNQGDSEKIINSVLMRSQNHHLTEVSELNRTNAKLKRFIKASWGLFFVGLVLLLLAVLFFVDGRSQEYEVQQKLNENYELYSELLFSRDERIKAATFSLAPSPYIYTKNDDLRRNLQLLPSNQLVLDLSLGQDGVTYGSERWVGSNKLLLFPVNNELQFRGVPEYLGLDMHPLEKLLMIDFERLEVRGYKLPRANEHHFEYVVDQGSHKIAYLDTSRTLHIVDPLGQGSELITESFSIDLSHLKLPGERFSIQKISLSDNLIQLSSGGYGSYLVDFENDKFCELPYSHSLEAIGQFESKGNKQTISLLYRVTFGEDDQTTYLTKSVVSLVNGRQCDEEIIDQTPIYQDEVRLRALRDFSVFPFNSTSNPPLLLNIDSRSHSSKATGKLDLSFDQEAQLLFSTWKLKSNEYEVPFVAPFPENKNKIVAHSDNHLQVYELLPVSDVKSVSLASPLDLCRGDGCRPDWANLNIVPGNECIGDGRCLTHFHNYPRRIEHYEWRSGAIYETIYIDSQGQITDEAIPIYSESKDGKLLAILDAGYKLKIFYIGQQAMYQVLELNEDQFGAWIIDANFFGNDHTLEIEFVALNDNSFDTVHRAKIDLTRFAPETVADLLCQRIPKYYQIDETHSGQTKIMAPRLVLDVPDICEKRYVGDEYFFTSFFPDSQIYQGFETYFRRETSYPFIQEPDVVVVEEPSLWQLLVNFWRR